MRVFVPTLALALLFGCEQKLDHPDGVDGCDAAVMDCTSRPPAAGSPGGGNEGGSGGSGTSGSQGAAITGQVVQYGDDYFDQGSVFAGSAEVSAMGVTGARVTGKYNGSAFDLEDVLKASDNWFMVKPEEGAGMLTTLTPVDTLTAKTDGYAVGLAGELLLDGLFVLAGGERSTSHAQAVVTVVDDEGHSIRGVQAALTAEVLAYRQAGSWVQSEDGTDDSGMIFIGNIPASAAMTKQNLIFTGAVSARVEIRIMAGATSVLTAVVTPP